MIAVLIFPISNHAVLIHGWDDANETIDNSLIENSYNKIHFYTGDEEYTVIDGEDELIEAKNHLDSISYMASEQSNSLHGNAKSDTDTDMDLYMTVQFVSDFTETETYRNLANQREHIDSVQEVREFRKRLNAFSKEYHYEVVNCNLEILEIIDYDSLTIVPYSPFVVMEISSLNIEIDDFTYMMENSSIEHISIGYKPETEVPMVSDESDVDLLNSNSHTWQKCLEAINAYDIVSEGDIDGGGAFVGVLESGGVCDINDDYLSDKYITLITDNQNIRTTNHATNVLRILTGIAPYADYFVAEAIDGYGIAYLLDELVDVVNCSFGYVNYIIAGDGTVVEKIYGYRQDIDGLYDYQASTHYVTIVKSAGNYSSNPSKYITSPGYAYNVITVGGVSMNSENEWVYDNGACYNSDLPEVKPNIAAPNKVIIPGYSIEQSGTSYAAPMVTAAIALLVDSNSDYLLNPMAVISTVTATAAKTTNYVNDNGFFNSQIGAGIIDVERMLGTTVIVQNKNNSVFSKGTIWTVERYFGENLDIQVGLAWLAFVYDNVTYVTDYDLMVYDSEGNLVASSVMTKSNVETVSFNTGNGDTFRISVVLPTTVSSPIEGDELSLAYSYTVSD